MNKVIFLHRIFRPKRIRKPFEKVDQKIIPSILSNAITSYAMLQGGRLKIAV